MATTLEPRADTGAADTDIIEIDCTADDPSTYGHSSAHLNNSKCPPPHMEREKGFGTIPSTFKIRLCPGWEKTAKPAQRAAIERLQQAMQPKAKKPKAPRKTPGVKWSSGVASIATPSGKVGAVAQHCSATSALCLTRETIRGKHGWTVTHVSSGYSVGIKRLKHADARAALLELAPLADWSLGIEQLQSQQEAITRIAAVRDKYLPRSL